MKICLQIKSTSSFHKEYTILSSLFINHITKFIIFITKFLKSQGMRCFLCESFLKKRIAILSSVHSVCLSVWSFMSSPQNGTSLVTTTFCVLFYMCMPLGLLLLFRRWMLVPWSLKQSCPYCGTELLTQFPALLNMKVQDQSLSGQSWEKNPNPAERTGPSFLRQMALLRSVAQTGSAQNPHMS